MAAVLLEASHVPFIFRPGKSRMIIMDEYGTLLWLRRRRPLPRRPGCARRGSMAYRPQVGTRVSGVSHWLPGSPDAACAKVIVHSGLQ